MIKFILSLKTFFSDSNKTFSNSTFGNEINTQSVFAIALKNLGLSFYYSLSKQDSPKPIPEERVQ